MSATAEIILIVDDDDRANAQELAFWMGTADAVDPEAVRVVAEVASGVGVDGDGQVQIPLNQVGPLLPLNGPVGEQVWGGFESSTVSMWGSVTANLHWSRFLDRVASTRWTHPGRLQLLMRDDGDTYFRMYMLGEDGLVNVVPEPPDLGCDRPWQPSPDR